MVRGRKPARNFFNSAKDLDPKGWGYLNHVEKKKAMNDACSAWHNRDVAIWTEMTSFTLLDSASDYSFRIPKSTFLESYDRYVHLLEQRVLNQIENKGLFQLVDVKVGRKPIPEVVKETVVDVAKGMKKVGYFFVLTLLAWSKTSHSYAK